jgi:hypothetical protein
VEGFRSEALGIVEKYLEAALADWRVVRLGSNELTAENVGRLASLMSEAGQCKSA